MASAQLSLLENSLKQQLMPIFANLSEDILDICVRDPSNLSNLQLCIDDLLELRTYTRHLAQSTSDLSDSWRRDPVVVDSDDDDDLVTALLSAESEEVQITKQYPATRRLDTDCLLTDIESSSKKKGGSSLKIQEAKFICPSPGKNLNTSVSDVTPQNVSLLDEVDFDNDLPRLSTASKTKSPGDQIVLDKNAMASSVTKSNVSILDTGHTAVVQEWQKNPVKSLFTSSTKGKKNDAGPKSKVTDSNCASVRLTKSKSDNCSTKIDQRPKSSNSGILSPAKLKLPTSPLKKSPPVSNSSHKYRFNPDSFQSSSSPIIRPSVFNPGKTATEPLNGTPNRAQKTSSTSSATPGTSVKSQNTTPKKIQFKKSLILPGELSPVTKATSGQTSSRSRKDEKDLQHSFESRQESRKTDPTVTGQKCVHSSQKGYQSSPSTITSTSNTPQRTASDRFTAVAELRGGSQNGGLSAAVSDLKYVSKSVSNKEHSSSTIPQKTSNSYPWVQEPLTSSNQMNLNVSRSASGSQNEISNKWPWLQTSGLQLPQNSAVNNKHQADLKVKQNSTVNSKHQAGFQIPQNSTVNCKQQVGIPIPQNSTMKHPAGLQIPQNSAMNIRNQSGLQIKQNSTMNSRHPTGLQIPQNSVVNSTQQVGLQIPQNSTMNSKHPTVLQKPQNSTVKCKQQTGLQIPQNSIMNSKHPTGLQIPQDSTVNSKHPVGIQIPQNSTKNNTHPVGLQIPQNSVNSKHPTGLQIPQNSTLNRHHPAGLQIPKNSTVNRPLESTQNPVNKSVVPTYTVTQPSTSTVQNTAALNMIGKSGTVTASNSQTLPNKTPVIATVAKPNNQISIPSHNATGGVAKPNTDPLTITASATAPTSTVTNPDSGEKPGTSKEIPAPKSRKECLTEDVIALFGDADPEYVRRMVEMELVTQRPDHEIVNNLCNLLLENHTYPRVKPSATVTTVEVDSTPEIDDTDYYEEYKKKAYQARLYYGQVEKLLMHHFIWISAQTVRQVLRWFDGYYAPTHQVLSQVMKQRREDIKKDKGDVPYSVKLHSLHAGASVNIIVTLNGNENKPLSVTLLKNWRKTTSPSMVAQLDPYLQKEVNFVKRKQQDEFEEADHQMALMLNETEYEESGQLIECGCCYGEVPFDNMIQCYEGHLFCEDCLQRYAKEAVFGSGKADLMCMTEGCDASYPVTQLSKALPSSILSKYQDRVQEENLNLADLPDLVRCPHCDFAAMLDPGYQMFHCANPACEKETCRHCQEPWSDHVGKTCDQVEKKDEVKLRVQFEEKMTMAKIRTCFKCKTKFTKSEGCNKMTCRCGSKMCYICRKPNIDYNHFCQHVREPGKGCDKCTACFLWSTGEEDDKRAIEEIRKQAEEARKAQGYGDSKLIGAPDEPPKKKVKI